MTTEPSSLRVVLVGGVCRVEPDTLIDTRVPIPDDHGDHLILSALSSSEQWWQATTTLAKLLLRQDSRSDAWVLACGPESLRVRNGDRVSRPRLESILPGEATHLNTSDFRETNIAPWTCAHSASHLASVKAPCAITAWDRVSPTAIIVSLHGGIGPRGTDLVDLHHLWPEATLIVAHCPTGEKLVEALRSWRHAGEQPLPDSWSPSPQQSAEWERRQDSATKYGDQRPIVVHAEFSVTRVILGDEELPPQRLAAAVAYLDSRYDLSLGVWDVLTDPGLSALVRPREDHHVVQPGPALEAVPRAFRATANRLEGIVLEVDRELRDFPLGRWRRDPGSRLVWKLEDPELPIVWSLHVDASSILISPVEVEDARLSADLAVRTSFHSGYGWRRGVVPENSPRIRDLAMEYFAEIRPDIREDVGARKAPRPSVLQRAREWFSR